MNFPAFSVVGFKLNFPLQASEDVQCFLRTAKESSRMDGVKLLNQLELKCTVIERLTGLFHQLIAGKVRNYIGEMYNIL